MDLPELNVWFALLVPEHPFHAQALSYWEDGGPRLCAGQGFRPGPPPHESQGDGREAAEAWDLYRTLRATVPLWEEPEGLEAALEALANRGFPHPLWTGGPSPWRQLPLTGTSAVFPGFACRFWTKPPPAPGSGGGGGGPP